MEWAGRPTDMVIGDVAGFEFEFEGTIETKLV